MSTSSEISSNFSGSGSVINLRQIFGTSSSSSSSLSSSSVSTANLNEENLQTYLNQFKSCTYWNPSDDSDFEETSSEIDIEYENEKQIDIEEERRDRKKIIIKRKENMKKYYDRNQSKMKSIFNLQGMRFTHFSHKLIYFIFTPSAFCKKYISVHRKYYISVKYENKWWNLKQLQVPNKTEVINFFTNTIADVQIMKVLYKIYQSLVRVTQQLIKERKNKHKKYLLGEEVYFNYDDEKLLLTPEERKKRTEKLNAIWNRMLPP